MAKKRKNRRKRENRRQQARQAPAYFWEGKEGFHGLIPGKRPTAGQVEEMTRRHQEQIRKSPLWDEMVQEFGREKAEALLKQCRVKVD